MRPVLVLLLATLVLTACEGAAPGSREDFLGRANQICEDSNTQLVDVADGLQDGADADEVEQIVTDFADTVQGAVDQIRVLDAPAADRQELDTLLDDTDQALDDLRSDPLNALQDQADPFDDINQRLSDFGLVACGAV